MTLAYYDTFSGLVPCRIVAVGDWSDQTSEARIQITATRAAYKRGEFLTTSLRHVVPRDSIRQRRGYQTISPYHWNTKIKV